MGQGYKFGGLDEHKNNRFELLDWISGLAELSPTQANQWVAFRTAWDVSMAADCGENWGFIFYDIVMGVLADLVENKYALSRFMDHEKMHWCINLSPEGHLLPHG